MAKYLKSLFQSSEKRSTIVYDFEAEDGMEEHSIRRKLSMSRSGRLRQANKKRHSLSMELYGEDYQKPDKPKTVEYHVNSPIKSDTKTDSIDRRRSAGAVKLDNKETPRVSNSKKVDPTNVEHRRPSTDAGVLETEIDSAFEIIDQT